MIHIVVGILVIALVWALTAALGLPYIVSGVGVFGGGRGHA